MKDKMKIKKIYSIILVVVFFCTTLIYDPSTVNAAETNPDNTSNALQTTIPPTEQSNLTDEEHASGNYAGKSEDQTTVRAGGTSFSNAVEITFSSIVSVDVQTAGEKNYFKFRPTVTGEYVFFSYSLFSGNPVVSLYNSSQGFISSDDNGGGSSQFRLSAYLVAGSVYYIEAGHYGNKTGQYNIYIVRDSNLANGKYYFQNHGTSQYIDIHGPVEQNFLHQWVFSYGDQAKWNIARSSDGYYTIQSLYGSKKYVAISNTNVNVNNVILQTSVTNSSYWKIYTDSVGRLYIEPKIAAGKILYAPNKSTGTELQLENIGAAFGGKHLWYSFKFQYTYAINHYYDNGFNIRFSSEVSELPEYQKVVSNAFLRIFGLSTNVNGFQMYVSAADSCRGTPVTVAHTTTGCTHEPAHKTRTSLATHMASLYGYGNNTTVKSVWTGHDLVDNRAVSFSSYYTIVIPPYSTARAARIYTLMHETSHQLGAADHYCYNDGEAECSNQGCWTCYYDYNVRPKCIMDTRDHNIESKLLSGDLSSIYCEICLSSTHDDGIFKHLSNHH